VHDDSIPGDDSDVVLDLDRRVKLMESFQVFYPDGTVSTLTGGQQNIYEFQNVTNSVSEQGLKIECRMEGISRAAADFQDDNLVNGCQLQLPFARGGLNEEQKSSPPTKCY
jgi:hypothetical protein